jgi:hypothetical protein
VRQGAAVAFVDVLDAEGEALVAAGRRDRSRRSSPIATSPTAPTTRGQIAALISASAAATC